MIAESLPYPPLKGGDLRSWQNINGLTRISEVGVFGIWSDGFRKVDPPTTVALWRSATDRALTYPPPKDRKLDARAWLLDPMGHPSDLYYSDAAAGELTKIMGNFKPHVVVVETLWLHRYIEALKRYDCRIVLDCHNVEALVSRQIADSTSGEDLKARLIRETLPARTKFIEGRAVHAADQIWVCSQDDARLMKETHKQTRPIRIIPNTVDVTTFDEVRIRKSTPSALGSTERTIIFPGIFAHKPNAIAAEFLIEQLFPKLTALCPDCKFLLVGSMPTPKMVSAAERDPRIVVTGQVPDVRPYLAAASVMVVPLFQGGGTRFKILEAFASNVPVISTPKGSEGLNVVDGTHLLIAESVDEFVNRVQQIWAGERLAKYLGASALELVKECYSWSVSHQRIDRAINELNSN